MIRRLNLTPLTRTALGRPVWALRGGDGEGEGEGQGGGDGGGGEEDGDGEGEGDGLTDAGRQAIARQTQAAKRAQESLRPWKALAKELGGLTPEQVRERLAAKAKDGDDQPVDVDAIRREVAAETEARVNVKLVRAEIKAQAASTFIDPADALLHLDASEFEVDEEGEVDADAIVTALKAVLKSKPHLAKRSKPADYEGGARKGADKPRGMSDIIREQAAARAGGGRP